MKVFVSMVGPLAPSHAYRFFTVSVPSAARAMKSEWPMSKPVTLMGVTQSATNWYLYLGSLR